ncbi:MAG: PaaI family thioesterase [Candidatus Obscuribacterales bacterium]|nr:PaaI family thioesterase [Candidatus Obscuribacterales bacterium]
MSIFQSHRKRVIKTLDPNFEQKIRDSFQHQGVMQAHNGKLAEISPGYVELHLPFSNALAQQHGFFHGGIVATLADSASGYATYTVLAEDEECLSAEFKVNFLSPAKGSLLIARGSVLKAGRTLVITEASVSVVQNGVETECALMLHTLARVKHVKSGQNN